MTEGYQCIDRRIKYSLYSHAPNLDFLENSVVKTQSGVVLGTIKHLFLESQNLIGLYDNYKENNYINATNLYENFFKNKVILHYTVPYSQKEYEHISNHSISILNKENNKIQENDPISFNVNSIQTIKTGENVYVYGHSKNKPKYYADTSEVGIDDVKSLNLFTNVSENIKKQMLLKNILDLEQ